MLALAGLALSSSQASAEIPPAGQAIVGRSLATYELNGTRYSVFSNVVSFSVLPAYGLSVTPDGTTDSPAWLARAFGGETVSFAFRIKNSGNAEDGFNLSIAYPAPSDFLPAKAAIYLGVVQDSIIVMGDTEITAVGPLQPGEEVSLFIAATLPPGLTGGEVAHIDLVACSDADRTRCDMGNVVRIEARREAQVALTLAADGTTALPGDSIGFAIHFANAGERTATDIALSS